MPPLMSLSEALVIWMSSTGHERAEHRARDGDPFAGVHLFILRHELEK